MSGAILGECADTQVGRKNAADLDGGAGKAASQPIRFPVEAKGRFEPATVSKWLGEYSINIPDMHHFDETGAGHMLKRD